MSTARRILYVDDDAGLRRLAQRELERHGFVVTLAADGFDGARIAAAGHFDAICLDHYMPGQDGMQTLEQLRAMPDCPPVVFVTGAADGRIAVAALRAGAADYVIKETGPEFLALIRLALEGAIASAALRRAKEVAETAVREALARAEDLAKQRALLLAEMNHRVANSLQLITSLARVQEAAVEDPAARAALATMRTRIAAVAQLHRRLYTTEDVGTVDAADYLAGLLDEIGRAVGGTRIVLQAETLALLTDRVISLGVIVNELVTNALKYAYPGEAKGEIRVLLARDPHGACLTVEDDGVGSTAGEPSGTGLGRRVVDAMAMRLRGQVDQGVSASGGTRVSVRFALD